MTWTISPIWQQSYFNIVKQALKSPTIFDTFRSHVDYNAIVTNCMTKEEFEIYTEELDKIPDAVSKLETLKQMDIIGLQNEGPSPRNLRYLYNAFRIKENFGEIKTVVEIGVGYGGMCFTMGNIFDIIGYRLIDIDCVVELARLFLSKLPTVCSDFSPDPPYDLCISECSLTELDDYSIQSYYNKYLIQSQHLFIRTNFRQPERLHNFINMIEQDFTTKMTTDFPDPDQPKTVMFGWKK